MLGVAKELRRRGVLEDHALVHKDHAVGHRAGKGHLVRDDDHGHAVGSELAHDLEHLSHDLGVERGGRLVEQHNLRIHAQGTSDGHALFLTTGQAAHGGVRELFESHARQMLHRNFFSLGLAHLFERDGRKRAVVEHIHVVEQVKALEHHTDVLTQFVNVAALGREILAVEPDVARVRGLEQVEAAQEGRLARTRGADDGDDLAGVNGQVDALEHLERAEALAQALDADERLIGLCGGRNAGSGGICHDDSPRL